MLHWLKDGQRDFHERPVRLCSKRMASTIMVHAVDNLRPKGIPSTRRERIEAAVVAGGKSVPAPYEAWISTDLFRNGVKVMITGPSGFQRQMLFPLAEEPGVIREMVRRTLEDDVE